MIEDLRERVRHMNPIDDIFLRKMAEDPGFCQEVIRTSTGDASIVVDSSDPQFVVTNLRGRSVVLDVRCIDKDGTDASEILDEGRAEGRAEGVKEMIREMLTRGKRPQEISDFCGVPIDLVNEVQGSMVVAAK